MKSDPGHPGRAECCTSHPGQSSGEAISFPEHCALNSSPLWAVCKMERAVSHTPHQMSSQKAVTCGKFIDSHMFLRVRATKDDIGELKTRWESTCETPLAAPLRAPVLLVWAPAGRFSSDMNHNDRTNELNQQSPVSFTRLTFHYFPLQRKCKTKTSGPVDGHSARASTSATELKQQQPNLSIAFSFLRNLPSPTRKQKEIFPWCFISGIAW